MARKLLRGVPRVPQSGNARTFAAMIWPVSKMGGGYILEDTAPIKIGDFSDHRGRHGGG
jgi:hypothetical protein